MRMRKIYQSLQRRRLSDRGDSLVTLVLILPLIVAIMVTMIDASSYFTDRAQITNAARDGARTIAIFGGNGTATQASALEKRYGDTSACDNADYANLATNKTPTECNIAKTLLNSHGMINVSIDSVACGPSLTDSIGERTYCTVKWHYGGLPMSGFSLLRSDSGGNSLTENTQVVSGSSESEVQLNQLVSR